MNVQRLSLSNKLLPITSAALLLFGTATAQAGSKHGIGEYNKGSYTVEMAQYMKRAASNEGHIPADKMLYIWSWIKANRILTSETMIYGPYERHRSGYMAIEAIDKIIDDSCDEKSLGGSNVVQEEQEVIKSAVGNLEQHHIRF